MIRTSTNDNFETVENPSSTLDTIQNNPIKVPQITEEELLAILYEEIVPAEGCTEPIALAYSAAKALEILNDRVEELTQVKIHASGNIIKNVKSVVIPNSGGAIGIPVAVALGLVAGKPELELMVISHVTEMHRKKMNTLLDTIPFDLIHEQTEAKLYIKIELISHNHSASVEIKHLHTNITQIIKDGKVILQQPCNDADCNSPLKDREKLSIWSIYQIAHQIDLKKIAPLFEEVIKKNKAIAEEGLKGIYGVNIGQFITESIENGFYGNDVRNRAAAFASAGSDARMSGCPLPVMTTSGSGNQGMTASLPVIAYAAANSISKDKLIRALFFSHAATIHIKTNVGRLSAYCGVICAAAAVSGALCILKDDSFDKVAHAIMNTLGSISGIICDGAKASCAMKIATSIYAAFDGAILAIGGRYLHGGDGIIANEIEETLNNIGRLSQQGMQYTDDVIIDIMCQNKEKK
ncbi:MAG: L-serine ammonia-lyase, iron-sulfur-dependent, subunit alpha [Bacteroidaceae bacterium]